MTDGAPSGERNWLRHVLVAGLAIGLLLVVALTMTFALNLVFLILAGVLFAIGLIQGTRGVAWLTGLSYRYAYAIVLCLAVLLGGGVIYLVGDSIAQHGQQLVEQLASSSNDTMVRMRKNAWGRWVLQQFPDSYEAIDIDASETENEASSASNEPSQPADNSGEQSTAGPPAIVRRALQGQGLLPMVGTFFSVTGSTLGGVLIVGFLAIYFALDPDLYLRGMAKLVPIDRRQRFLEVMQQIAQTLWWWIIGRLVGMTIIGTLSTVGLWMIGIPMALPLGVMAGLLNFIPNVGPTLALVPPLLFGLQEGTTTAVYVFFWYLGLQFVETYIISPLIEQNQVSLPPGVTIPVQVLFGITSGVFGLFMATPTAAVIMVLIREYYVKDWLGDANADSLEKTNESISLKSHKNK